MSVKNRHSWGHGREGGNRFQVITSAMVKKKPLKQNKTKQKTHGEENTAGEPSPQIFQSLLHERGTSADYSSTLQAEERKLNWKIEFLMWPKWFPDVSWGLHWGWGVGGIKEKYGFVFWRPAGGVTIQKEWMKRAGWLYVVSAARTRRLFLCFTSA